MMHEALPATLGAGVPAGLVASGANTHDKHLLAPTLASLTIRGRGRVLASGGTFVRTKVTTTPASAKW